MIRPKRPPLKCRFTELFVRKVAPTGERLPCVGYAPTRAGGSRAPEGSHLGRRSMTIADLRARYLEEHAKRVNRSWKQADAPGPPLCLATLGKLQVSTITRGDVKALKARFEAPIAANQTLAAISAIFTWAVKEEIVSVNPCKLVARNAGKSRERVLRK